jgi:5,10-methylenetetrahydrofolate reductase
LPPPSSPELSVELNPPRILDKKRDLKARWDRFLGRVAQLKGRADLVELTDSVLGIPRYSGILAAALIRERVGTGLMLRCNVRVRDRGLNALIQLAGDAEALGLEGLLFLSGDPPRYGASVKGLRPGEVVKELRALGVGTRLRYYLATGLPVDPDRLAAKLAVEPDGIITQPVPDLAAVEQLADLVKPQGVRVVAGLLVPSDLNRRAAEFLGLDWSSYYGDVMEFLGSIRRLVDEVLLTSPNDFKSVLELTAHFKAHLYGRER